MYDTYDIFKSKADGSGIQRLTDTKGYDAEATVCAKDGSIVFTSVRDGDLELYRMDKDGKNVKRLTFEPGRVDVLHANPRSRRTDLREVRRRT